MSVSVFQLLMARREQIEAARSYVESLRDYWTAQAEAEQLRSGRLPMAALADAMAPALNGGGSHGAAGH